MDFKISDTNKGKKSLIYDGFIFRIDAQFYSAHPSIFVFIDVLQKVQATTYLKMRSTDQAVTARKEDKTRTEFTISQYRKYSSGESTRLEYIESLGYMFIVYLTCKSN